MNIRHEVSSGLSKSNAIKVANYIGCDAKLFKQLVAIILENDIKIAPQAAWTLSCCVKQCPDIIYTQLEKLIDNLDKKNLHDAVKRNTVLVMQYIAIPEALQGKVANTCFRYLSSNKEAIAVRAFSMTVLYNICIQQPELKNELKLIVKEQMRNGEPAIVSRGKKVLNALGKI